MRHQALMGLAVVAVATTAAGSARADGTGFALDHYNPSERGSDWFAAESLDLRGHLRLAVGAVGDYGYKPLVLTSPSGDEKSALVSRQGFVHAGASLVMWDRLRLSLSVPLLVTTGGTDGVVNGVAEPAPAHGAGVGDVRVGADVRLFGTYRGLITGVAGVQAHLPTGSEADYSGDGKMRAYPRVGLAGKLGMLEWAGHTGFVIRRSEDFGNGHIGSTWGGSAAVGLRMLDEKLLVGPEFFGETVLSDGVLKMRSSPIEWVLGGHYQVTDAWRVGAGVASGLNAGFGTPKARGLLSVEWAPGYVAAPPPPPPPPPDRDKDGIVDADDACPDVKGVKTSDPKTNGCPPDRDQDGIVDAEDACPDVKGVKTSDPKTNGCPPDRDHDGILDAVDACPDVAGVKSEDPKKHGCPVDPDRDKDGIKNEADACPDVAGPANADPKKNGCPQAYVEKKQIKILDQVKFETASAKIKPGKDSQDVLAAVLDVLKKHPEIKKVRVEGHTDNKGSAPLNRKLSADRAAAVVTWLIGHGLDKGMFSSAGYGPDRPVDTNDTDAGRQNNRRVEFHIDEEEPAKK